MDKPLLIVQPEVVETAKIICDGFYDVLSISEEIPTDRPALLWPDATTECRTKYRETAGFLSRRGQEVRIIVPNGQPEGWNLAQAIEEGWDWPRIVEWARSAIINYEDVSLQTTDAPDPIPRPIRQKWHDLGLFLAQNGTPVLNIDNVVRLFRRHGPYQDIVWFDEFHQRYFNSKGEWTDTDTLKLTQALQQEFGLARLDDTTVGKAIQLYGHSRVRNEPRDWMHQLRWDGRSRIDRFFIDYMGAQDQPYAYAIGRNFWVGMVARVYSPGCQLDNMVILEGRQGTFKTSALRVIGGKWYMEAHEQITSKDFFLTLQGRLIVELSELDAFSKADATRIKQVISCTSDRYRAPYAKSAQDNPRRSIFVGSTNEKYYLRDNTGARRFWPIACGIIRLDDLKRDREQLFAEARTRYLAGEDWHIVPMTDTLNEQEDRRQGDEWENIISGYLHDKNESSLTDIAAACGVDKARLDIPTQRRLGSLLRRLGWENKTVRRGYSTLKVWLPVQPLSSDSNGSLHERQPSLPAIAGPFDN